MDYLVACNWDLALIDRIDYPGVSTLFAGLPNSLIGSGRPSSQIRPISDADVKKYVDLVHQKGWTFDFNVNASCTANRELTRSGFKDVLKYLAWVADLGADAVTVSNTNLIQIVRKNFPRLKVNLSTFQKVSTVAQARRYEDLGVDMLMLSEHINRDFKLLAAIRKAVRCKLTLIANVGCIFDCPNAHTHANSVAHSGTKGDPMLFAESFILECFHRRLESTEELVKIRWIRPEDVSHYEEVGIDMLKILERNTTTEVLAERVKAYSERRYEGNLLRFLGQMVDQKTSPNRTKELVIRRIFTRPGLRSLQGAQKARQLSSLFEHSLSDLVHLDNQKIPQDFIEGFKQRDCRTSDCRTCGHCKRVADQVVRVVDEPLRANTRQRIQEALDGIRDGSLLY